MRPEKPAPRREEKLRAAAAGKATVAGRARRRGGRRIRVRKSSGSFEGFDVAKLRSSLAHAGASHAVVEEIVEEVLSRTGPETSSREIYKLARSLLGRQDRAFGMRYTLKNALFRLGPSGYPFEHYVAMIFRHYGWRTTVGVTVAGRCVSHEVDVIAERDGEVAAMECKYHNDKGTTTDVKTALYVHSRMRDLRPAFSISHPGKRFTGWLVTNTRCTTDARQFARCMGLRVLSWKYPEGGGLEEMIEKERLYPVTILSGLPAGVVERLVAERILLLRDILTVDAGTLARRLGTRPETVRSLRRRAEALS